MFPVTTTRSLACSLPRMRAASQALFHTSRPALVNVGDRIPDLTVLCENSPGNKVNLSQELKEGGLIIGVPAAFSMSEVSLSLLLSLSLSLFSFPQRFLQKFMHRTPSIHTDSHGIECIPLTNHVFVSPKLKTPLPRRLSETFRWVSGLVGPAQWLAYALLRACMQRPQRLVPNPTQPYPPLPTLSTQPRVDWSSIVF